MWRFSKDWGERNRSVEINGKNNENGACRKSGKPMWNTHDFDLNKDMRLCEEERAGRWRRGSTDNQRKKAEPASGFVIKNTCLVVCDIL